MKFLLAEIADKIIRNTVKSEVINIAEDIISEVAVSIVLSRIDDQLMRKADI